MNKKYERYIEFIVSDLQPPYFENMKDSYGLKDSEYELVLSKLYNQPVTIQGRSVYDNNDNTIYREDSNGYWEKYQYDTNGINEIYREDSTGNWYKYEYDTKGNLMYYENSDGDIEDNR